MKTKLLFCFLLMSLLASAQTYKFSTLYAFQNNGTDPANPDAALIVDSADNLYGVSDYGGKYDLGTVFKVTKSGKLIVLHSFQGGSSDGAAPQASLIRDAAGNLYGTTGAGGDLSCGFTGGCGTVFKLSSSNQETILFSGFDGYGVNGAGANSVVRDSAGNFYGTAAEGIYDDGLAFKLDTHGDYTILHYFCVAGHPYCPDGEGPQSLITTGGNFYGTTNYGGDLGAGTVYEITPEGVVTVLHSFGGTGDGQQPDGSLRQDAKGNLYGVTQFGGINDPTGGGYGILFKQPEAGGPETVLYNFGSLPNCADGCYPVGPIAMDKTGNIYGIAVAGDINPLAVVWEVNTAGKETILHTFGDDTVYVAAGIIIDSAGNLYGVTDSEDFDVHDSLTSAGSVFKLTLEK